MSRASKIVIAISAVFLIGFAALHTGFARWVFFELFAYVKGVDVLSPTVVREPPVDSPYERWLQQARGALPMFEGMVIEDVSRVALEPWPKMGEGVKGLYLRFADYQMNDGRILQIPANGRTAKQRHLYEKAVYVISGSGYTEVQQEGRPADRIDWTMGDLFSLPLNVAHQHYAGPDEATRLLAVTSFPLLLNVMDDEQFVLNNDYAFYGRYDGDPAYFGGDGKTQQLVERANFVKDLPHTRLHAFDFRGPGNRASRWQMAGNSMLSMHVSEIPPLEYKKAHRHTSDAFILLLSGEGFSVTWPEGAYHERARVDWRPGTLFVPPTYWYHQHLNTGKTPARYLAINSPTVIRNIGLRFIDQLETDTEEVRDEWEKAMAE